MKNIQSFEADKYTTTKTGGLFKKPLYAPVEEGIYQMQDDERLYVTSLSFEQESELGEGQNAGNISQYPLEDVLDKFYCHVSDFYEELNAADSTTCYLEFASPDIEDIRKLRSIIGKHVYDREREEGGRTYVDLAIE
ncbi:MAG: hypothetical protein IJ113_05880 [Eggerthellaceae bacterium]|nr:hypothetical protein [Eggerthellaceae bacterium]